MMEVALVFDRDGKTIHWHLPPGRSGGFIPDTRDLWEVIWENRHRIGGVAHTHPWHGPAAPSGIDLGTFRAIELGLGIPLIWPIVTFSEVQYFLMDESDENTGPATSAEKLHITQIHQNLEIEKLRELSR